VIATPLAGILAGIIAAYATDSAPISLMAAVLMMALVWRLERRP
jgi:hypothetical protein